MRVPDIIALLVAALVLLGAWKLHKDESSSFNILDLVLDGGRLSRLACVFIGAFAVASWVMIRVALDGKMTDAYLLAYGAIFVAPIVAKLFSAPPPAGTTTTSISSDTTTTVAPKPQKLKNGRQNR